MLKKLGEVLKIEAHAVGSFNIVDLDMARAIVSTAEMSGLPVIIGIATRHWNVVDIPVMAPSLLKLVECAATDVVLHLDHAGPQQLEIIQEALDLGFTSIMIDGSSLQFDRNCEITKRVMEMTRPYGAHVEAELGAITGLEGVAGFVDGNVNHSLYTDPGKAEAFIRECPVEALAVSVGTAHGLYKTKPKLQFKLIEEINRRIPTPLVLHGATGVPDDAIIKAISLGVRKINYFSGLLVTAMDEVRLGVSENDNDYIGFRNRLVARWKRDAQEKLELYACK